MALFKQDPRFTRVKYYEDYNPSKVFLRDSNFEGVEFLIDDNGPTVFAVRRAPFYETTYFQKYIFAPFCALTGVGSGLMYLTNSFKDREYMSNICLGSSLSFSTLAVLSYVGAGAYDYSQKILNARADLFVNRKPERWAEEEIDLRDVMSPLERRDFIFDQTIETIAEEIDNFSLDLDVALGDDVLVTHFHKAMGVMMEDYNYIIREKESHLKSLKLERLARQWETFQLAIPRHPHRPSEFVVHSSLNHLSEIQKTSINNILANLVDSRHQIIKIRENSEEQR